MASHYTIADTIGECGCCGTGGDCLCTCCNPLHTGDGIWREWDLVLGGGSPIRLTKVNGECLWKSADGLYRVKRGIVHPFYCVAIYASAGDDDYSPIEGSTVEQVGLFGSPEYYSWCRTSTEDAAIIPAFPEDLYLPTYAYDWSLTPVSGTWQECIDDPVGVPDYTEPPNANWTECD